MPRVEKKGTYEATWSSPDEMIRNDRTGKEGKSVAGKIRIAHLESGIRWYVSPAEFFGSGWGAVEPKDEAYFKQEPHGRTEQGTGNRG